MSTVSQHCVGCGAHLNMPVLLAALEAPVFGIGDRKLVAKFCPRCGTPLVFEAKLTMEEHTP